MPINPWSGDYFNQKSWERVQNAAFDDFLPYDEVKEKYIAERIEPLLDRYRESDHDWFKEFSRRRGTCVHASDLIYRLQQLNPHIFVQQQINYPDDWGLYSEVGGKIQYLSAVPKGWLTEFSYSIVDERDLPTEEKRGWRTVVVMCMLKGAVTWEQVLAEFGDPEDSFNDQRWQETVRDFHTGGDQVVQRNVENTADTIS